MASQYQRGATAERRVKKYFEERGYFVVRSAGSHSPVDLVAVLDGKVTFVQVKSGQAKMTKAEEEKFIDLGRQYRVHSVVIAHVQRGGIQFDEFFPVQTNKFPLDL